MADRPDRTIQLIVRVEPELHEALRAWANGEDRTMAAQVRTVLWTAMPDQFMPKP